VKGRPAGTATVGQPGSASRARVAAAVRELLARELTVYDCAGLFRAHPRAIEALLVT
jgi:hypothetical protein